MVGGWGGVDRPSCRRGVLVVESIPRGYLWWTPSLWQPGSHWTNTWSTRFPTSALDRGCPACKHTCVGLSTCRAVVSPTWFFMPLKQAKNIFQFSRECVPNPKKWGGQLPLILHFFKYLQEKLIYLPEIPGILKLHFCIFWFHLGIMFGQIDLQVVFPLLALREAVSGTFRFHSSLAHFFLWLQSCFPVGPFFQILRTRQEKRKWSRMHSALPSHPWQFFFKLPLPPWNIMGYRVFHYWGYGKWWKLIPGDSETQGPSHKPNKFVPQKDLGFGQ